MFNKNLMMMKLIKSFIAIASLALVFVFSYTPSNAGSEGTLMGNEAGTKCCCSAGTNSCAASACKQQML